MTQSERSHREKNYTMLNWSDHFMKYFEFDEVKKFVSIS